MRLVQVTTRNGEAYLDPAEVCAMRLVNKCYLEGDVQFNVILWQVLFRGGHGWLEMEGTTENKEKVVLGSEGTS